MYAAMTVEQDSVAYPFPHEDSKKEEPKTRRLSGLVGAVPSVVSGGRRADVESGGGGGGGGSVGPPRTRRPTLPTSTPGGVGLCELDTGV